MALVALTDARIAVSVDSTVAHYGSSAIMIRKITFGLPERRKLPSKQLVSAIALLQLVAGCAFELDPAAGLGAESFDSASEQDLETQAQALSVDDWVQVERVRHCRNGLPLPCNSRLGSADFEPWDRHDVDEGIQKHTYIAKANDLPPHSSEYVAFFSAGQQFTELGGSGSDSNITGQDEGWHDDWKNTDRTAWRQVEQSLATDLLYGNPFPQDKTFAALAFDARFNYGFASHQKDRIVAAYSDWVLSHINRDKARMVYLAGASRGGCLMMRVAKRLNETVPRLPVVVHSFDGVCNVSQGELGTTNTRIDNPLQSSLFYNWFAWGTDITQQYPHPNSLALLHLVGGHPALGNLSSIVTDARAFSHTGDTNLGWYEQLWLDKRHVEIETDSTARHRAQSHVSEAFRRFSCGGGPARWDGTGCSVPRPILQVGSGKCLHPQNGALNPGDNTQLVLHGDSCLESSLRLGFRMRPSGSIEHIPTGKCVHPFGGSPYPGDNTPLVLHGGCDEPRLQFQVTSGGSLRHVMSGKCVHPSGGSPNPADGTVAVLHGGCDEPRLRFSVNDSPPIGWLDHADRNVVRGWACDRDIPASAIDVHIYFNDRGYGVRADRGSEFAVNNLCGGGTAHRFEYVIPDSVKSQLGPGPIQVRAYGINNQPGALNTLLSGSPRIIH